MRSQIDRLRKLEKQMDEHRTTNCQMCWHSIARVDAQTCPIMLDLNRQAREAARKVRH